MSTRKSSLFYGFLIAFTSLVAGMVLASRLGMSPASLAGPVDIPATNSAPIAGPLDTTTFRTIAHEAGPSVVSITARGPRPTATADEMPDFFGFQLPPGLGGGGRNRQPQQPRDEVRGGSGFIIDKSGHILTNNHVVQGATAIEVRLASMERSGYALAAKIIGRDELTDTALLQLTELPKEVLVPARFGDSAQMAPGDWVMAIGSPFNLSNTVTVGVVSATGRPQEMVAMRTEEFIQTDAAINSGNSGGPLLNVRGEVIGINTMIATDGVSQGNLGIGFAVPINRVRDLLPQLQQGKVTRGRIAVTVSGRPISEEYARDLGLPRAAGAEITSVIAGGPADKAGMKAGDVVIEFNGKPVNDDQELVKLVAATQPGTTVPVKVVRERKTVPLNVTVAELNLEEERRGAAGTAPGPREETPQDTGLGMDIQELTPRMQRQLQLPGNQGGAVVTDIEPFSPAANAGLRPGDVIRSVQGQPVSSVEEATAALERLPVGRTSRMIVWRVENGQGQEILVQIRKR